MAHLAGVSDHIRACRLPLIVRSTDSPNGDNLRLLITPN